MNISPEEAQEALAAIKQTNTQMHKAYGYNGYYLMLWGLIWFVGFLASQYIQSSLINWIWGGLITIGWVVSTFLGVNQSKQVRSIVGPRIGFFYLALIGFTIFWFIILQPLEVKQGILFLISIIMFGGVVVGVFARSTSTITGSVSITVLAVVGYYLVPVYFDLWVAVFCGLAMFGIGLTLRLKWR
ncbi:MAG TPA: hypothetical protein VKR83_07645 [Ktedonobacteraceae bacterium]|nr:hypothetical protein [Ktedonobacteraceae bacterium]